MMEGRKCDFCGSPAQAFMKHVQDGEDKTISLCNSCMESRGIDLSNPETILNAFDIDPQSNTISKEDRVDECSCGTSCEEAANGLLGCGLCYDRFRNILHDVWDIKPGAPATLPEIDQLEIDLQSAVDDERYEEAAKIRDRINGLNGVDQNGDA